MILSTLISVLGGTGLRMIWGEVSSYITKAQDHKQEMARLAELERQQEANHQRNLELLTKQAELHLQEVRIVGDNLLEKTAADTFDKGVELANKSTGYAFVDIANSMVRCVLAYEVILLLALNSYRAGFVMDDRTWELAGAVIGIYIADRTLFRRGK